MYTNILAPARRPLRCRARRSDEAHSHCKLHATFSSRSHEGTVTGWHAACNRSLAALLPACVEVRAAFIDKEADMNKFLQTTLGVALALGTTGVVFAADAMSTSPDKSAQPGTDTWITTKVKAELATTKGISSNDISVTTKNGNVTLSSVVDTKAQVQKSVAVAKSVKGVHSVDSSALSSKD